jgi:hypothetical protein
MPNLINNQGNVTDIAANYNRTFSPFTRFGTRQLAFFQISLFGLSNNTLTDEELDIPSNENPYFYPEAEIEYEPNGYFQKAIQAIETRAEIYGVFRPGDGYQDNDGNSFIVMVAMDTVNVGSNNDPNDVNFNNNSSSIADVVSEAIDEYVEVFRMRIRGGSFRWTDLNGLEVSEKAQAAKTTAGTKRNP